MAHDINGKLMKNKSTDAYFGSIENVLGPGVTVHDSFVRSETLSRSAGLFLPALVS